MKNKIVIGLLTLCLMVSLFFNFTGNAGITNATHASDQNVIIEEKLEPKTFSSKKLSNDTYSYSNWR